MKGIYPRGGILWMRFTDAGGVRRWESTGLPVGQEEEASRRLQAIHRQVAAERELLERVQAKEPGPVLISAKGVTVAMYWGAWVSRRLRIAKYAKAAKQNVWQGRDWVLPRVGHHLLTEFRPRHARAFAEELGAAKRQNGTPLGSSSVHTIWAAMHGMFQAAVIDELISANPCVLERGVLPKKRDKDPDWRGTAVYSREEVEQLVSHGDIPLRRRMAYALLFLAGLRPQELSALHFRAIDTTQRPLGRLDIWWAWDSDERVEKPPKNEKRRLIPIHPTLAKLLAQWRLTGWQDFMGRTPESDDLVMPADEEGHHLQNDRIRKWVHKDIERLGWRRRRAYDTRRTFHSLCTGDGIPRDIFKWWTHGPDGQVQDLYTTVPWDSHCTWMLKLNVSLREGVLVKMAAAVGGNRDNWWDSADESKEKARNETELRAIPSVGATGFEALEPSPHSATSGNKRWEVLGTQPADITANRPTSPPPVPLSRLDTETVLQELTLARNQWKACPDRWALIAHLKRLLAQLSEGA